MNLKLEIRNTLLDYDLRPNSYETLTEGLVRTFQDFLENPFHFILFCNK
jgi:hypothetical protein